MKTVMVMWLFFTLVLNVLAIYIILTGRFPPKCKQASTTGSEYVPSHLGGGGGSPADSKQEFWARTFPGSIRAKSFDRKYGTNYHGGNTRMTARDVSEAKWGRGRYAGKTGNVFVDDPFFNPWAPGGDFNK